MSHSVSWLIDKRVFHIVIEADVDTDTIHQIVIKTQQMGNEGIKPIHAIVDATKAESLPKHVTNILKEYKGIDPQESGFTIIIATSPITRFFAQALLKLMRIEVRFGANVEDALATLRRIDATLPVSEVLLDD